MSSPKIAVHTTPWQNARPAARRNGKGVKREIEESYKDTIVKRLLETHHFDLPETLIERELEAIIRQHMQQRQRRGSDSASALETEDLTKLRQTTVTRRPVASRWD